MPLYSTKMKKKKKAKTTIFCGCEREKKQLEEVREWLYYEVLCLGKTSPSNKGPPGKVRHKGIMTYWKYNKKLTKINSQSLQWFAKVIDNSLYCYCHTEYNSEKKGKLSVQNQGNGGVNDGMPLDVVSCSLCFRSLRGLIITGQMLLLWPSEQAECKLSTGRGKWSKCNFLCKQSIWKRKRGHSGMWMRVWGKVLCKPTFQLSWRDSWNSDMHTSGG